MKGGFYYGLRTKQLSLFFIGVVCTTIVIWTWEKTPILISLLPPPLDKPMQTFPAKEVKAKQVPHVEYGTRQAERSMNLEPALDPTNTEFPMSRRTENYSTTLWETNHENSTDVIKESDSRQVSEGENFSGQPKHDYVSPTVSANTELMVGGGNNDTVITDAETQACNLAKGKWVIDDNRPLYSGFGCKQWLSGMWACRLTQRTDFVYEKLKWQPKDCKMKDFTGPEFLKRMQDKTLAFIGDSLGRQQFQSMMCMITGGEERPDVLDVGWEYGLVKSRGATRPDGWAYRFPSTNTTILYYWSASLCDIEPIDPTNLATNFAMHLDRPPAFLKRYIDKFHVIVLNTGHHWNRGKLNANRWVMYVGGVPNTNRKIADIGGAKNFTIYSIVNWVNSQLPNHPGLKVFYRSISPRHFFNGDWNTGGTCDNTTPGLLEVMQDDSSDPIAAGATKGTDVKLLDITALSQLRDEGHISRYSIKAAPGMQDCLHWCMPGVPDTWNELLFAQI